MENQKVTLEKLKATRPTLKKETKYIENDMVRRSTYSRRAKSLIVAAMELEIQTGCSIDLRVLPTWPKGKSHVYHSVELQAPGHQEPTTEPDTETNQGPTEPLRPIIKQAAQNSCRICGQTTDLSFWLGCGYTNPRTKRQDCRYWVHQKCIGLFYKKECDLQKVPFFCPRHGQ